MSPRAVLERIWRLSRWLYSRLFDWLLLTINRHCQSDSKGQGQRESREGWVRVLGPSWPTVEEQPDLTHFLSLYGHARLSQVTLTQP